MAAQRPGDRQHLLLAARERAAGLAQPLLQDGEVREDLVGDGAVAVALRPGPHQQVLPHRELGEDAAALRHVGHAEPGDAVGRKALDRGPVELDTPFGGPEQPDQRLHQRRLADAVAPEQRQHLALAELAVDAGQDRDGAVGGVEVGGP